MSVALAAIKGFGTAFSLILAIGAQNAFVLRQGLKREHIFIVCLICALSDAILITAGVFGFGAIVDLWPGLPEVMRYGGAAFLIGYSLMRFWAAWRGSGQIDTSGKAQPLAEAVVTALALTWLNPHVYLDTLGLIGAVSTQFPWGLEKTAFGVGAVVSSFSFFFALGYGARLLAPVMGSSRSWQVLDVLIGVLMLWIAWTLLMDH